jgi:hypothetical protein
MKSSTLLITQMLVSSMLIISGCGALKATEGMPDKIDATNAEVKKTNSSVHNQTLVIALDEMLKPQNTKTLAPVPLGMMPGGQAFANEATATEMIQMVYVLLKDADTQPEAADSEKDANGHWIPEVVKSVDHDKSSKIMAAMIILGLAPQATIEEIVRAQIAKGGQYEEVAYKALMLRYYFTNDILLGQSLFPTSLTNPGKITEAIRLADNMTYISKLPFGDLIVLDTVGMLSDDDQWHLKLDKAQTDAVWQKIDGAFDSELADRFKVSSAGQVNGLRVTVKSHIPKN